LADQNLFEVDGSSLDDVVKVTTFIGNIDDYAKMDEVYKSYFPGLAYSLNSCN
jgi:enamine deaminase RidA (YjgF/YER057c/UK114 family)